MARHHARHLQHKVDLPLSVRNGRHAAALRRPRFSPAAASVMGLMSFMTCGVAVVVTASLLALQIN